MDRLDERDGHLTDLNRQISSRRSVATPIMSLSSAAASGSIREPHRSSVAAAVLSGLGRSIKPIERQQVMTQQALGTSPLSPALPGVVGDRARQLVSGTDESNVREGPFSPQARAGEHWNVSTWLVVLFNSKQ